MEVPDEPANEGAMEMVGDPGMVPGEGCVTSQQKDDDGYRYAYI